MFKTPFSFLRHTHVEQNYPIAIQTYSLCFVFGVRSKLILDFSLVPSVTQSKYMFAEVELYVMSVSRDPIESVESGYS